MWGNALKCGNMKPLLGAVNLEPLAMHEMCFFFCECGTTRSLSHARINLLFVPNSTRCSIAAMAGKYGVTWRKRKENFTH